MTIQQLNTHAKMSITLFLFFVTIATVSSVILLGLELTGSKKGINIPTVSQIESKYTTSALVSAMRGSMYQYVTEDDDIDLVDEWIKGGASQEDTNYETVADIIKFDCVNCHSKTSTMSKAIPSMPFETYEEIIRYTEAGYSWSKMSKQAHIHMFGIAMFLVTVTFVFAYSTYNKTIKSVLIIGSFTSAFLDIFSWWFSKYYSGLVYLIYGMGGLMVSSIVLMSVLIILNIWRNDQ